MPFLLIIACLVPVTCAAAQYTKRKFEEALPAVLLGLMASGYLFGLFGIPFAAVILFYAVIGASVIYLVYTMMRSKSIKLPAFAFGLLAVLFFCAVLWWACRNQRYANWDEFSHWGRALKGMLAENKLPAATSFKDTHKDYPPGAAVLQYILIKATGVGFREDAALFTQGLLSVSLLLYMIRAITKNNARIITFVLSAVAFVVPMLFFYRYYKETTVDGLLGVMFAFVLVVQFVGSRARFERVLQCLACAMLPTIKTTGLLFAVCAGFIILADELRYLKIEHGEDKKPPLKKRLKTAGISLSGAGFAVLSSVSWSVFINISNVSVRHEVDGFSFAEVWSYITKGEPAYITGVVKNYFTEIFANFNYGNLSFGNVNPIGFFPYMVWFAIFFGVFFLIRRGMPAQHKRSFETVFYGLMISGGVFVVSVLFSYMFIFDEMESSVLASISRYLNTYAVAVAVFVAAALCLVIPNLKRPKRTACFACVLIAFFLLGGIPPKLAYRYFVRPSFYAAETAADAEPYREAAGIIAGIVPDEGELPVYVISQNDYGKTTLHIDYELLPSNLPEHVSSLASPHRNPDDWTLAITAGDWMRLLIDEGYEYVYLFEIDDVFIEDYGILFGDKADIVNGAMFQIKNSANGHYFERIV